MKTIYCRVSGIVQGVFFRATTQQYAQQLGLTGWVRNTLDGDVEICATGEDLQLESLREWLPHGVSRARVDNLLCREVAAETFSDFSVQATQ